MLAGATTIVGSIILSQGIYRSDTSPLYSLIILSVLTIAAAGWYMNREPDRPEVSGRERVLLLAFRTVNILAMLVCFAFVVIMFFLTDYYPDAVLRNVYLLIIPATVSIVVAALNLKIHPPIRVRNIAKSALALIIAVVLCFVYINDMPKYSIDDGIRILRSDEEFAQKDVFYPSCGSTGEPPLYVYRFGSDPVYDELSGSNLFYCDSYEYYCDSYSYDVNGLHDVKGYIIFNPITGAYEYMRTHEQDQAFSPGELPEFDWNYMKDTDGQHSAVLNLYFREWYPFSEAFSGGWNLILSVSSDKWDEKLKDVMYPHNFPEDEARVFLQSMGEEALKTKLLKNNGWYRYLKDGTIEIYFFGIDIATYQNGEIILKR
jgi:hypothetical protein